jgi:hypothetical protein
MHNSHEVLEGDNTLKTSPSNLSTRVRRPCPVQICMDFPQAWEIGYSNSLMMTSRSSPRVMSTFHEGCELTLVTTPNTLSWTKQIDFQSNRFRGAVVLTAHSPHYCEHTDESSCGCLHNLNMDVEIFYYYWGHAVAWLVEALCYKPERRGVYSR